MSTIDKPYVGLMTYTYPSSLMEAVIAEATSEGPGATVEVGEECEWSLTVITAPWVRSEMDGILEVSVVFMDPWNRLFRLDYRDGPSSTRDKSSNWGRDNVTVVQVLPRDVSVTLFLPVPSEDLHDALLYRAPGFGLTEP